MDYHLLARRQLQSLCKQHGIPANSTNKDMADALSALLKRTPEPPDEKAKLPDKRTTTRGRDTSSTTSSQSTTKNTANEQTSTDGCETREKPASKSERTVAGSNSDDKSSAGAEDGGTVLRRGKIKRNTPQISTVKEEKQSEEIGQKASEVVAEPGAKETETRTRKGTVTFDSTLEANLGDKVSQAGENSSAAQINQSLVTMEKKTRSRAKELPDGVDLVEKCNKEEAHTANCDQAEQVCLPVAKETQPRRAKGKVTFSNTVEVKKFQRSPLPPKSSSEGVSENPREQVSEKLFATQIPQSSSTDNRKTRRSTKGISDEEIVELRDSVRSSRSLRRQSLTAPTFGEVTKISTLDDAKELGRQQKSRSLALCKELRNNKDSTSDGSGAQKGAVAIDKERFRSPSRRGSKKSVVDVPASVDDSLDTTQKDHHEIAAFCKPQATTEKTQTQTRGTRGNVRAHLESNTRVAEDLRDRQKGAVVMDKERFCSPLRKGSRKTLVDIPVPVAAVIQNALVDTTQKGNDEMAVVCKREETTEKDTEEIVVLCKPEETIEKPRKSMRGNVRAHLESSTVAEQQVTQNNAEKISGRQKRTSKPKVGDDARSGVVQSNAVGDVPLSESSQTKTMPAELMCNLDLEDPQQTDLLIAASNQFPNNQRTSEDLLCSNGRFVPHEGAVESTLAATETQLIQTRGVDSGQADILQESDQVDKSPAASKIRQYTRRARNTPGCNRPTITEEDPDKLKTQDTAAKQLNQSDSIASQPMLESEQVDDLTAASKHTTDKGRRGKNGSGSSGLNVPQQGMEKQKMQDSTEAKFRSTRSIPKPSTTCVDKGPQRPTMERRSRREKTYSGNEEAFDQMEDVINKTCETTAVQDTKNAGIDAITHVSFGEGNITDERGSSTFPTEEESETEMRRNVDNFPPEDESIAAVVYSGHLQANDEVHVSKNCVTGDTEANKGQEMNPGNQLMQMKEQEEHRGQHVANAGMDCSDVCGNEATDNELCEAISKDGDEVQSILTAECKKQQVDGFVVQSNFLPPNMIETVESAAYFEDGSLECLSEDAAEIAESDEQLQEQCSENEEAMKAEATNTCLHETLVEPTIRLMSEEVGVNVAKWVQPGTLAMSMPLDSKKDEAGDHEDFGCAENANSRGDLVNEPAMHTNDPVRMTVDGNAIELLDCVNVDAECDENAAPTSGQNGNSAETYLGEQHSNGKEETEAHVIAVHRDESVEGNEIFTETLDSNLEEQNTKDLDRPQPNYEADHQPASSSLEIMADNRNVQNDVQSPARSRPEFINMSHIKIDEETICARPRPIVIHVLISDSKSIASPIAGNISEVSTYFGQPVDFNDAQSEGENSASSKVSSMMDEAVEACKLSEDEEKLQGKDTDDCVVAPPATDSLQACDYVDVSLKDLQQMQMKEEDVHVVDNSTMDNVDTQMLDSMKMEHKNSDAGCEGDEYLASSMPVLTCPLEHTGKDILNPAELVEESSTARSEEQACLSIASSDANKNSWFVHETHEDGNGEDDQQEGVEPSEIFSPPQCNLLPAEKDHRREVSFVKPDDKESLIETVDIDCTHASAAGLHLLKDQSSLKWTSKINTDEETPCSVTILIPPADRVPGFVGCELGNRQGSMKSAELESDLLGKDTTALWNNKNHMAEVETPAFLAKTGDGKINDKVLAMPSELAIGVNHVRTPEEEHPNSLDILSRSGNKNDATVIRGVCTNGVTNSTEICGTSALRSSQCTDDKELEPGVTIAEVREGTSASMCGLSPATSDGELRKMGKGCGERSGVSEFSKQQSLQELNLTRLSLRKLRALCKENGPSVRKQSGKPIIVPPKKLPSAGKRSALMSLPSNVAQTSSTAEQTPNAKLPNTPRPRSLLSARQGNESGARSQAASSSKKAPRSASPGRMAWR